MTRSASWTSSSLAARYKKGAQSEEFHSHVTNNTISSLPPFSLYTGRTALINVWPSFMLDKEHTRHANPFHSWRLSDQKYRRRKQPRVLPFREPTCNISLVVDGRLPNLESLDAYCSISSPVYVFIFYFIFKTAVRLGKAGQAEG